MLPFDTVYGLAAEPHDERSTQRLYELKGRAATQPTALVAADIEQLRELFPELPAEAQQLLPGPFTLVVANPAHRFRHLTGTNTHALGLRVPQLTGITRDVTVRKMSDADFTEIIETNLVGTHRVTKAVLDHLCEAGHGRIVSIASFVAQLGNYGQANYAASKGGLISWTKTLAYEVARFGVTVNCVCPGFIDTDMLRGVPDHIRERLLARVPLGRFGDPDEIARGVVYLVRDGAYITGTCLDVNGGLYM